MAKIQNLEDYPTKLVGLLAYLSTSPSYSPLGIVLDFVQTFQLPTIELVASSHY